MVWKCPAGQILLVRHPGVLDHYKAALDKGIEDFIDRCAMDVPHTKETAWALIRYAVENPDYALLLAVDPEWRLVGFSVLVRVGFFAGAGCETEVAIVYMRPERGFTGLSLLMNASLEAAARELWGARAISMVSNKKRDLGWKRYGFKPIGTVYRKEF